MTKYWSMDYGFLLWNIIIDKKYYLLQSPITLIKKMSRMQKRSTRGGSRKGSRKTTKTLDRNIKRMEKMENDYDKIVERIDNIYKQIIKK